MINTNVLVAQQPTDIKAYFSMQSDELGVLYPKIREVKSLKKISWRRDIVIANEIARAFIINRARILYGFR